MNTTKQLSCYLIGQNPLLIACAKILFSRSIIIDGIISPSKQVQTWAHEEQIACVQTLSDIDWTNKSADYLFSIVNDEIIPATVLQKIRGLAINYHDALLPRYAGSNATAWAILNGETSHGISWHVINELIDAGDIVKQIAIPVASDETTLSLHKKCVAQAITTFEELVDELLTDSLQAIPQDSTQRSYFARSQKPAGNGWINWNSNAQEIERLCRATQWGDYRNPFSTAKMQLANEVIIISSMQICPELSDTPAGTVTEINAHHWKVSTSSNNVLLTKLSSTVDNLTDLIQLAERLHLQPGMKLPSSTSEQQQQLQLASQQCYSSESAVLAALAQFQAQAGALQKTDIRLQSLPQTVIASCRDFSADKKTWPLVMLTAWLIYQHRLQGQATISVWVKISGILLEEQLRAFFLSCLPVTLELNERHSFFDIFQQVCDRHAQLERQSCLNDLWQRYPELTARAELQADCVDLDADSRQIDSVALPEAFVSLFQQLLEHETQPIAQVEWVTTQQRQQLLTTWNDTNRAYPMQQTIHGMFEMQVSKTPEHIAIIAQNVRLTYQELNILANQLAHYLVTLHQIQPDQLIAVCLERSQWMLVALLGILKADAAYVPLAVDYPARRCTQILQQSAARLVITTREQEQQVRQFPEIDWHTTTLLVLDHPEVLAMLAQQPQCNPQTATHSRHLAYVLYTSGTTGTPKGIQIEHQGIVNRITWMNQAYPIYPSDRVLQKTPYVFDVSVWELFWANWYGATIVFAQPQGHKDASYLARVIADERISIIHFTPTMLNAFVLAMEDQAAGLGTLRHLFCSGEVLSAATVNSAQALLPAVAIHNLYGPTEASIDVLFYDCVSGQPVCLGKPIANTRVYVLDEQCRLLPPGVAGELYLAGDGLARGYLNDVQLTRERFIPNPYQPKEFQHTGRYDRLYKTGDLAYWLADGNIVYLGRKDTQVKLHGNRIELGEIETVLQNYPAISQCSVIVYQQQLIAYYVARQAIDHDSLQAYAASYLPDYMVPNHYIQLTEMPLSISGKIDQKKLPPPTPTTSAVLITAENAIQANLIEAFALVLGLEAHEVSMTDNIFKLGGNSIKALQMASRLKQLFGYSVQVVDILRLKTVQALSNLIAATAAETEPEDTPYEPFSLIEPAQYQQLLEQHLIEDIYPASQLQIGMLLESSLSDQGTYHDVFFYDINLPLCEEKFLRIWQALAQKNALLRARFIFSEQHVLDVVIFKEADLQCTFYRDQPLQQLIDTERLNHFSHTEECLFHLLVNEHDGRFEFLFSFHHAIVDGWSIASLINEFVQNYAHDQTGLLTTSPTSAAPLSYGEFVRNERRHMLDLSSLAFWKDYLRDAEPVRGDWKFDDTTVSPDSLFISVFYLNPDQSRQVQQVAHDLAISVDSVFMYAYLKTLAFFFNTNDVTIGVGFNNRLEKSGGDSLVGLFLNVIPYRMQLTPQASVSRALSDTFAEKMKLYAHKHIPYAKIKATLQTELFYFGFNFVHFHALKPSEHLINKRGGFDRSSIPVMLEITQLNAVNTTDGDRFKVELKAHDNVSSQDYLDYFRRYLQQTLEHILHNQNDISLDPQDYQQIALDWNAAYQPCTDERPLHHLFEQQVQKTPEAIALVYEDTCMSYRELNQHANQLARHILERHALQADDLIALCLDKNTDTVIAILAVLKCGAAYVPIDPNNPIDRVRYIVRNTGAKAVLMNAHYAEKFASLSEFASLICLDSEQQKHAILLEANTDLNLPVSSHQLAYVIYTSGTTGQPKGVLQQHNNVVSLFHATENNFHFTEKDVWLFFHSYVFDFTIWEIWGAFLYGGKLIIPNQQQSKDFEELHQLCKKNKVTVLNLTTAVFLKFSEILLNNCDQPLSNLHYIIMGGEKLNFQRQESWFSSCYQKRPVLVNLYGITETAVISTYKIIEADKLGTVYSIGKFYNHQTSYVVDKKNSILPVGCVGELCVGGDGLARGYLNQAELTQQRFIANPFQTEEQKILGCNARLYKSGDLVRRCADGSLDYIGRNDNQLKIRGYRIEAGEIETLLCSYPGIQQAKVLAVSSHDNDASTDMQIAASQHTTPVTTTAIASSPSGMLPIQEWFFARRFRNPHYFNQSFLIRTPLLDLEILKTALTQLVNQHDCFSLRFSSVFGVMQAYYLENSCQEVVPRQLNLHTIAHPEGSQAFQDCVEQILTSWQIDFDIHSGPMFATGYIHGYRDGSARVFFALHHLIVDVVSWHILVHDLHSIYNALMTQNHSDKNSETLVHQLPAVPRATGYTSYRQWIQYVQDYAVSHAEEKAYWHSLLDEHAAFDEQLSKLLAEHSGLTTSDRPADSTCAFMLSPSETGRLLSIRLSIWRHTVQEVLLTALALTLHELLEQTMATSSQSTPAIYLTLEGHGREDIHPQADLSHTLGWFTTMYPCKLNLNQTEPLDALQLIQHSLEEIPLHGLGYGSFFGYQGLPRLSFNYLGQLNTQTQAWSLSGEPSGVAVHADNGSSNVLDVVGWIANGQLAVTLTSQFSQAQLEHLAGKFNTRLLELIALTSLSDPNNIPAIGTQPFPQRTDRRQASVPTAHIPEVIPKEQVLVTHQRLVAYYAAAEILDPTQLRAYLAQRLPPYFIPQEFIWFISMPLTVNGKIDTRALQKMTVQKNASAHITDWPRNEKENLICAGFAQVLNKKVVGIYDDFFTVGGDSISAMTLVMHLQQHFQVTVRDIFSCKTPSQLAEKLAFSGNSIHKRLLDILHSYQQRKHHNDGDLKTINRNLNKYLNHIQILQPDLTHKKIRRVLLTGATGYLGCHMLRQLLSATDYQVYLIVRAKSDLAALERINQKYSYYFSSTVNEDIYKGRLFIFCGNLEQPQLGLVPERYEELTQQIDSIIHAAALVKQFGDAELFYQANVQATIHLLELSQLTTLKDFHYISTASVLKNNTETFKQWGNCCTEELLPENLQIVKNNIYLGTKLQAESQVIRYRDYGIQTSIYRVGNLAFMLENCSVQANIETVGFAHWLRYFLHSKSVFADASLELSPVDLTANAIVKLFDRKCAANAVFHVFHSSRFDLTNFFKLNPEFMVKVMNISAFIQQLTDELNCADNKELIMRFLLAQGWLGVEGIEQLAQQSYMQFKTLSILRKLGFEWPTISHGQFKQYLHNIFRSHNIAGHTN